MELYYSKGSCSFASHIVLEEAGAKFDAHRLNLGAREQRRPEFLKINPKGKVPTLVLDDGSVITENPAIISYVADIHPEAGLLAKPGELARAKAQEWLAWCAAQVHRDFGPLFHTKDNEEARKIVQTDLDQFDQWIGAKPYVLDRFTVADAYTLVFIGWAKLFKLDIGEHMRDSAKTLLQRAGVQRAVKTQELKFDL
jgi:glutathione S-transferase